MLVRPIHHEAEFGKWMAILALAAALCILFASALAATDVARPARPALLPPNMQEWSVPLPGATEDKVPPELVRGVWSVLQLHHDQRHEEAIAAWNKLELPAGAKIWKWVAVGQALTAISEFEGAEEMLGRALDAQPDNALAHYFTAVLRMQQAYLADEWPDVIMHRTTRLVAFTAAERAPRRIVPNTKGMYELAATRAFEQAIEFAPRVKLDEALVPTKYGTTMALEPTVGDLLLALGAERFDAKAHNALSYLFLERGALEVAERHMDEAVQGGLTVVYGYGDLGDEYTLRGQHADAARAYLKAARFSANKLDTLRDAWESFRRALVTP
jgi:tetratricopeptide (TPR) repeat protein